MSAEIMRLVRRCTQMKGVTNRTMWGGRMALGALVLLGIILAVQPTYAAEGSTWFRGQLHTHTYWSDGRGFPEQVADIYKQRGYQFLAVTDHNRFAEDKAQWRVVAAEEGDWPPDITQEIFDTYVEAFGKEVVESKTDGSQTLVRLKTYAEIKAQFEELGRFLLLPGVEITQTLNGHAVHQNYINLPLVIPSVKDADLVQDITDPEKAASDLLAASVSEVTQASTERKASSLFMLNHPFWRYYDVVPQSLIDCPGVRFFEVCNGGSSFAPCPEALSYTVEQFWDTVNAFRSLRGEALLYGIGSDDAHYYDKKRIDRGGGVGDAWVMVRAEALTPEHLIAAMDKGDFYASTGVYLDDVAFTAADNTLRVKVKAEEGVAYRVCFITTKRGFDQTVTEVASPEQGDRPERVVPVHSEDIGRVVKTVSGTEGEYQLDADDLYVRARIESDRPSRTKPHFHPLVETAWTQPYVRR